MIDADPALRSASGAFPGRATARPGRRSLIVLLAAGGGGFAIAGAALPWLTVYQGLDSYSGIGSTNGRVLAAGGALAALLALVYRLWGGDVVRYLIGALGFVLALFSAYLVAQLLTIYRQLHDGYFPALGPGVFVGAAGALLVFSTLFVTTEPEPRAARQARDRHLGPASASLVALSAAAGTIHLTVASDHFAEYFLFGLFFVVVGVVQIAWAATVAIIGPGNGLLTLSLGNAFVVVLWVLSRTTGVPIGANAGVPEKVGYADAVTTAFEVLLVALATAMLVRGPTAWRRSLLLWGIPLLITPTTALAVLSAVGAIRNLPTPW